MYCELVAMLQVTRKSFKVTRGASYAVRRVKRQAELTNEMLASGSWKDATFKPYNFKTLGAPCGGGNLHPLLKVCFSACAVDRDTTQDSLAGMALTRNQHRSMYATASATCNVTNVSLV